MLTETDPKLVKLQIDLFWAAHSSKRSPHELFQLQPRALCNVAYKRHEQRTRNILNSETALLISQRLCPIWTWLEWNIIM